MADRAVVLGGGGVTGVAWEIGMLTGLAERGLLLAEADLVIGTSAGSVVGVDLRSGVSLADIYAGQLAPADGQVKGKLGVTTLVKWILAMVFTKDPVEARKRIGAMALRAKTESEASRRTVFESLPIRNWPVGGLQITAVDAVSGEFTTFDASSAVNLIDAVGASCAVPGVWPPVTINGRRYIDGGMRSPANADLAAGYRQVIVLAPITQGFGSMTSVGRQVAELTSQGARVLVITPDDAAVKAIGRNVLDPAHRAPAARAGYAQAASEAAAVAAVWSPVGPVADDITGTDLADRIDRPSDAVPPNQP